jgi:hypothetical protein
MTFFQVNTSKRWVRTDNFSQVRDRDTINLLKQKGMLVQRQGVRIYVYLESDFTDFFVKHVQRKLTSPDPVLVKNFTEIPSVKETRELVKIALTNAKPGTRGDLECIVPQLASGGAFQVLVWNPAANSFLPNYDTPIARQVFKFRDINIAKSRNQIKTVLEDTRCPVPKPEAQSIIELYANSFTTASAYTVDDVFVTWKIVLYRADWHGARSHP